MSSVEPATELERQIEAAFDFRGDVTLRLRGGETAEGYLFNRELQPHPKLGPPFVELMLAAGGRARYPIAELDAVELTGKDHASG